MPLDSCMSVVSRRSLTLQSMAILQKIQPVLVQNHVQEGGVSGVEGEYCQLQLPCRVISETQEQPQ